MAAVANLATTLATFMGATYLYISYRKERNEIWSSINTSAILKRQRIKKIIKQIFMISIPITLSALLGAVNKNIDAFTVVRYLKNFMTDENAKIQYGILSGKIDTIIAFPLSFNIAFSIALVPRVSSAIAKKDFITAKNTISYTLLLTILIGLPCSIRCICFCKTNIIFIISKCNKWFYYA